MSRSKPTRIIIACTVAAILAVVLFSLRPWEHAPADELCTLTTAVRPPGAGSISPAGGEYQPGLELTLTASPAGGYVFDHWAGDTSGSSNPVAVNMTSDRAIAAHFAPIVREVRDWHDLHGIRDNLSGRYILMNDLDSTTPGYAELAGETANGGRGWQPIGDYDGPFTGSFNGQGHEIMDLFISRTGQDYVGLFAHLAWRHPIENVGAIENVGVVNASVIGHARVGALVGHNAGIVKNSYSTCSVNAGGWYGGGLVGYDDGGLLSDCHSAGNVTGTYYVGGLIGRIEGARTVREGVVNNCYSTCNVTGFARVGGLAGSTYGDVKVNNSYFTGSVSGTRWIAGVVAENYGGTLSNCYSTGLAAGHGYVGGLVGLNLWGTIGECYSTSGVTGEGWYVGGLVGQNDRGSVNSSFWDVETSRQLTSDGGTGKTTTEMMSILTFVETATQGLDDPWDMVAVAPGDRDDGYAWNIVDGQTYPFLSWQTTG